MVTPPIQAPDFRLKDQHGTVVSTSALRGKVVALTSLYTHCPDACPLIADMVHKAYQRLGKGPGAWRSSPSASTPAATRRATVNAMTENGRPSGSHDTIPAAPLTSARWTMRPGAAPREKASAPLATA